MAKKEYRTYPDELNHEVLEMLKTSRKSALYLAASGDRLWEKPGRRLMREAE